MSRGWHLWRGIQFLILSCLEKNWNVIIFHSFPVFPFLLYYWYLTIHNNLHPLPTHFPCQYEITGLKKKIMAVSKLHDCQIVGRWKRSINNHLYWCAASTRDGDGAMMQAKFASLLNHMRNIHEGHGDTYPKCAHGEQYSQREWMRQGKSLMVLDMKLFCICTSIWLPFIYVTFNTFIELWDIYSSMEPSLPVIRRKDECWGIWLFWASVELK